MIEVLIGIALTALFCLIFTYSQWHIIGWQKEAIQYLQAVSYASSQLEKALAKENMPTTEKINEFTINFEEHTVEPTPSIQEVFKLNKNKNHFTVLKTTVSWNCARGKVRSITIVGGIVSKHET